MNFRKLAVAICAGSLAVGMLAGCAATPQNSLTDEQKANREYMSAVNQKMTTLGSTLDSFNDAVSREDVVTMKTQAANASKVLDELANVETPEAFTDVHTNYVDGAKNLEAALNEYIELYSEIQSATEANPFDWSSYDQRVQIIQSHYDEGVAALKAGDEAVSAME